MNSIPPETLAELERIQASAPAPSQRPGLDDHLAQALENLVSMAPEPEPEPVELLPFDPSQKPSGPHKHPIHPTDGWPLRYTGEMAPPTGQEWLDSFKLAQRTVEAGGILILHGLRGTGKTRMAAELGRLKQFPDDIRYRIPSPLGGTMLSDARRSAIYATAMAFFVDVRDTYAPRGKKEGRSEKQVIDSYKRPGLLVIDELQERGESDWENRLLTHLIDARYGSMRPTILIANLPKEELKKSLGASIIDRVAEGGRRIEFTWGSYRQRRP